ncbi:MAG TPA: ABC transporter ATP-binding protein [Gammaproteobacteria bacterium]|nr:ABC transporter ATP-binding protein [Gammaproteobacteria bacterium]
MQGDERIVEIRGLERRFGKAHALAGVSLAVPRGTVFGLVGANGAGKTTLIRHVMGLLRAEVGEVRVFGRDPVAETTAVLSRIGYLSEVAELPEWMRVAELIAFTRAFYPRWDDAYAEQLRRTFELDAGKRVRELSKGQRARLGLLLAVSHRPELLVLDEPSSGLDPLVRRDILRAIVKTIADEGRTVLFSSHLLDEVERVADHVAIIDQGRIVADDTLDGLRNAYHRVVLRFDAPPPAAPKANGFFHWEGSGPHWSAFFRGEGDAAERAAAALDARLVERATPTLNELFVALAEHEPAAVEPRA